MILKFPSHSVFELALTSGIVPEAVSLARVEAGFAEDGTVLVQASKRIPSRPHQQLLRLGATVVKAKQARFDGTFSCWHQVIPAAGSSEPLDVGDKTDVIFELTDEGQLPDLINEILRQGNDRQSFRYLDDGAQSRALLRVIGPPYYSLLRALEKDGRGPATQAFVEASPRVWVQLGYRYPLADRIKPPAGKLLLIRPPRQWLLLAEAPFRDVYEVLEFELPSAQQSWNEAALPRRIPVPLRLTAGSSTEAAELWVLTRDAVDQVEQLVRNADDRLMSQLAFAVGTLGDETMVVIRARPSKQGPPVLVLDGVAFRSYLRISNLFLPVGRRLHPPLRRDAVAKLLAKDRSRLTWLWPAEDGSFVPQSLADDAFRPLTDWVDYILDREHAALDAWVAAHRFDFESFVCPDEKPVRPKPPVRRPSPQATRRETGTGAATTTGQTQQEAAPDETGGEVESETAALLQVHQQEVEPNALQVRLRELESQYQQSETPLDSRQRQRLWREMGMVNSALGRRHDATICWSYGLWEDPAPSSQLVDTWLNFERQTVESESLQALADRLVGDESTLAGGASGLVAYLLAGSCAEQPPRDLVQGLTTVAQALRRHEPRLPVRTVWLAWTAVVRLSHGDVLALARARDRILERLFQVGLTAESDLPGFLRGSGIGQRDRLHSFRQHVIKLRDAASNWIVEPAFGTDPQTGAYADLMFAYALARLGDPGESRTLADAARQALTGKDQIHSWVRDAFDFRIRQAAEGNPNQGRLDQRLLDNLAAMQRLDRYKIDRLRQHSWILEPHERIDPYRRWHQRYTDALSQRLAEMFDESDRDALRSRLLQLMTDTAKSPGSTADEIRVLTTALELSPRLGASLANRCLDRVFPLLNRSGDPIEQALLLEKALLIAAHFDVAEAVQAFVARFDRSMTDIVARYMLLQVEHNPENKEKLDTIESLFDQSLKGLRKLGMREEVSRLYGRVAESIGDPAATIEKSAPGERKDARRLTLALIVSAGWFYFGQNESALRIADQVRQVLFSGELPPVQQKDLACAYIRTLGQASVDVALPRLEELFQVGGGERQSGRKLPRIEDTMTTSSHFSISQFDFIEALVLALVSDDAALDAETRRWLDEDEFLVRRRIHRDMREALRGT